MRYPICDQLLSLEEKKRIPFHMPGHKRKGNNIFQDVTSLDITEITDYDNLHHPEGMIAESMEMLREIYHSKKSWYLINGSTVGILSAISAVCRPGDHIMVARNCHKAVYNAIRLLQLHPVYLYPSYSQEYDMLQGIHEENLQEMEKALEENPEIKALVITSPTYEGVVSDIRAIKSRTEKYQIPLIVDEAHGAHFIFHDAFPKSAVECGADIVIESAHKTLPSFTQTALLHLCSSLVSQETIEEMISIYQSSSPSYLLMASAEYGVLYTQNHPDKVQSYVDKLLAFRRKCAQLRKIRLLEKDQVAGFDYDIGKLVFLVKNSKVDGKWLFSTMLERFHIEFEMETAFYCIAMTSINDSQEDFYALEEAIFTLDRELVEEANSKENMKKCSEKSIQRSMKKCSEKSIQRSMKKCSEKSIQESLQECSEKSIQESLQECSEKLFQKSLKASSQKEEAGEKTDQKDRSALFATRPVKVREVWQCIKEERESLPFMESHGRIAGDYIYLYPPGIPILVPGEKIEKEMLENISYYLYNGYNVPSISKGEIKVLKE